jgi:Ulp1 family protease
MVEDQLIVNSDWAKGRKERVTAKDLLTLLPNTWVNDVIVNFYLRELMLRSASAPRAYIFRSQLWQSLSNEGSLEEGEAGKGQYNYAAVQPYTRDRTQKVRDPQTGKSVPVVVDIFDASQFDLVLFPICHKAHWSLCV